jgi:pyruvate dehydrogenase (quinone)
MNGNGELVTIEKYWKQWSDPRLIILVLNNSDLNQVTWEQRVMNGDPKYTSSQVLPEFRYAAYAESLGLKGIRLDNPEDAASAWKEALSADRPVVIEARTDPEVPPLPPHITLTQARHFMGSLAGDPARGRMFTQSVKDMVESFVPHHS